MHAPLQVNRAAINYPVTVELRRGAEKLTLADRDAVVSFLETNSLHAALLSSMVRDNGIVSIKNRGTFYGYRNERLELEGVALIGHSILMDAKSDESLRAFAEAAQLCTTAHMILCEENRMEEFWRLYAPTGQEMRGASRQLLFELRWPSEVFKPKAVLRQATLVDLSLLIPVHADMARSESGVDPRVVDPVGFAQRYTNRIEQGRTWVSTENGKLIFKADVINETTGITYIEGVWVNPDSRRQGYGLACMSQLARMLLWRTKSLCLLVNDEDEGGACFVKQAGYHLRGVYDAIFLK